MPQELGPAEGRARLGFGRERRLRRRTDFLRVQGNGLRAQTPHFVLLVDASPDAEGPSRLGVVVTRKVGNAVRRNRIRRLCRECFRRWPGFVPAGIDLVVIARAGAYELALADVQREWERARSTLLGRCQTARARASSGHEDGAPAPSRKATPR
jgi:ribonuclease P protein component